MKYIVPGRKRLPYGMMNFADIRLDNYYYVDKTRFIPMIEEADRFFFFIRPRRFGKTLNMSMLNCFFSNGYADRGDLFEGPSVWEDERYECNMESVGCRGVS